MRCTERGSGGDPVTEPTWALTRSQLIDALGVIGVKPLHVPGRNGGLVLAEDMADAILEQLTRVPGDPVTITRVDAEWALAVIACYAPLGVWSDGERARLARLTAAVRAGRLSPAPGAATDGPGHGELSRDMAPGRQEPTGALRDAGEQP
jgi:hypothetical protein